MRKIVSFEIKLRDQKLCLLSFAPWTKIELRPAVRHRENSLPRISVNDTHSTAIQMEL
jgi:hypothetical protein